MPGLHAPLPLSAIGLLASYTTLRVWTDTVGTVLQSMNDLVLMWFVAPIQSFLSIGLRLFDARWFGLPGVVGGLIGCLLLSAAWVVPLRCRRHVVRNAALG